MTMFETSQGFVNIGTYRLNVTARLDQINREHMTSIVEKTVKLWLYVAKKIAASERQAEWPATVALTPEDIVKPNFFAPIAEPRCTVWGDTPNGAGFTVHSYSTAQDALDVFWSRFDALAALMQLAAQTPANEPTPPPTPQNANLPPSGANGGQPTQPVAGVITANFAPSPKNPRYAPGQLVALPVNKVSVGTRKGSITYDLWGPLGKGQYPLLTIFKTKQNSDENSMDYIAAKDFIVGLGLSMDAGKIESHGNWRLICQVSHSNGKEYFNIQKVEAAA